MTSPASNNINWKIQVRKNRTAAWKNKSGLFETRWMALHHARTLRDGTGEGEGYGRGNVRVVKHVKATK